nr:ParB/RepB/Spo0J family partition protein [Deinococcus sp. JMULE3]
MEELRDRSADAQLPIASIRVLPEFNPRRLLGDQAFTDEALADLAQNIRTYGVLQPVLVRRRRAEILLVAGERRLRAATLAGLTQVPVIYVDADDARAYEIAIIENAQRNDLDLVTETLVGFQFLSRRLNLSSDEIVSYLHHVRKGRREDDLGVERLLRDMYGTGISVWGQQRALILRMTAAEREAIQARRVDAKVCAELVALTEGDTRSALLDLAIREGLTARQVRELVRNEQASSRPARPALTVQGDQLRRLLPRLNRLEGEDARRAGELLSELNGLLSPHPPLKPPARRPPASMAWAASFLATVRPVARWTTGWSTGGLIASGEGLPC